MNYKWILLAVVVPFIASPAFAGEGKKMDPMTFNTLDADQDGMISKSEAASYKKLTEKWSAYDTNMDGMLEEAEFSRFEEVQGETKGMMRSAPANPCAKNPCQPAE